MRRGPVMKREKRELFYKYDPKITKFMARTAAFKASLRECTRCVSKRTSKKVNPTRCKKQTCKTARKCWQHLKSENGLQVKMSRIAGAGQGLFATRRFRRNEKIDDYKAQLPALTQHQINRRYPGKNTNAAYVWCTPNKRTRCYDARSSQSNLARYANGCDRNPRDLTGCNAKINVNGVLVATKQIEIGNEILTPYGANYWKGTQKAKAKGVKTIRR